MAVRKKAATTDTTKINVAVIAEHLKSIDSNVVEVRDEVKGVKEQFVVLNGKVNKHASDLAVINSQDLDARLSSTEAFKNRIIGGLVVLNVINLGALAVVAKYIAKLLSQMP